MELKVRDVYQDLPSDARILLFHRANNAKAQRINGIMKSAMPQDAPPMDFEALQRRRQEKSEYFSAISEAIRKKQLMKATAAAEGVSLAAVASREGLRTASRGGKRALTAARGGRTGTAGTGALRPSTSAPVLAPVSPISTSPGQLGRAPQPTSPTVFKYVPVKQRGVRAGDRCNEAQRRLTDEGAVTGVQKFRRSGPNALRGQGDLAPHRQKTSMLAVTNGSNLNIKARSSDVRTEVAWRLGLREEPVEPSRSSSSSAAAAAQEERQLMPLGAINHNFPVPLQPMAASRSSNVLV